MQGVLAMLAASRAPPRPSGLACRSLRDQFESHPAFDPQDRRPVVRSLDARNSAAGGSRSAAAAKTDGASRSTPRSRATGSRPIPGSAATAGPCGSFRPEATMAPSARTSTSGAFRAATTAVGAEPERLPAPVNSAGQEWFPRPGGRRLALFRLRPSGRLRQDRHLARPPGPARPMDGRKCRSQPQYGGGRI